LTFADGRGEEGNGLFKTKKELPLVATTVQVGNFDLGTTHSYPTKLLNSQASEISRLAKLVHEKVDGDSLLFLWQFLLTLAEGGYRSYWTHGVDMG